MYKRQLPVIMDLLKDPVANAEILAAHKVDTDKYQQQVETEDVKQKSNDNEHIKKTEEMEKTEELKQEKDVQHVSYTHLLLPIQSTTFPE